MCLYVKVHTRRANSGKDVKIDLEERKMQRYRVTDQVLSKAVRNMSKVSKISYAEIFRVHGRRGWAWNGVFE